MSTDEALTEMRSVLERFADSVRRGDARSMCELLVGDARKAAGCGTDNEDISPQLQIAIRSATDLIVVEADESTATVVFPDHRQLREGAEPEDPRPQRLFLRRRSGDSDEWAICDFDLGGR